MEIPLLEGTVSLNQKQINTYKQRLQNLVTRLCPQTCDCKPAPVKLNCNKQGSLPMRTYPQPGLQQAPPPPQYQGNSQLNSGMPMGPPPTQLYPGNSGMPMGPPPHPPSSWGLSPASILVVPSTISFQQAYNNGMGGFYQWWF